MSPAIFAAGTVCWRRVPADDGGQDRLMVLLIHRTKQRDVSFPKGKLDPGESMQAAAVRETREETGLSVSLGMSLGTISYAVRSGATKTVQYWAAEVTPQIALASTFAPNNEVQALEWVPWGEVPRRLSYAADRDLFAVFGRLVDHDLLDTFSVTLLRHAKAVGRGPEHPEDRWRPLTATGSAQAETLVPMLAAFAPKRIHASTATRCLSTVSPLAAHLDRRVRGTDALSQDTWDTGELEGMRKLIAKIVKRGKSAIVCSHRPVLPDIARELVLATGSVPGAYLDEATSLPPAGFSVFHLSRRRPGAGILSVETYPLKH